MITFSGDFAATFAAQGADDSENCARQKQGRRHWFRHRRGREVEAKRAIAQAQPCIQAGAFESGDIEEAVGIQRGARHGLEVGEQDRIGRSAVSVKASEVQIDAIVYIGVEKGEVVDENRVSVVKLEIRASFENEVSERKPIIVTIKCDSASSVQRSGAVDLPGAFQGGTGSDIEGVQITAERTVDGQRAGFVRSMTIVV